MKHAFFVNGYLQLKLYETSTRRYVHKGATDVGISGIVLLGDSVRVTKDERRRPASNVVYFISYAV